MKDLFIRFLKDNHAFEEFKRNLQHQGICFDSFIRQYRNEPANLIRNAFVWDAVPDDVNWYPLHMSWKKIVTEIVEKKMGLVVWLDRDKVSEILKDNK